MDVYFENQKFVENGIPYPFRCHTQTHKGKGVMVDAHYHETIEILLGLQGCFHIFLDGRTYYFQAGDMVIINSMEVHSMLASSDSINQYAVIRFEPELLYTTKQTVFEAKYVLPFTMKRSTHQRLFPSSEISDTFIPELVMSTVKEDEEKTYGFELAVRTNIGRIFLWILRRWNQMGLDLNLSSAMNSQTVERLQLVFDYVDQHYEHNIGIEEVAKLSNMSYSYFSRFFKTVMKQNFSSYVNFVRVSKAEELLTTTDLSITEVALNVGFSTTSYFIEQFKLYKAMTPRHFRHIFNNLESLDVATGPA